MTKSINIKKANLKKTLELKHLIMLGLAGCIGGGIMTQVGDVIAKYTGIGIFISYLLAGLGCILVALPYCELAAMIPCSGGIYSYSYIAFGRFFSWIMFVCILGQLSFSSSIVSIGFSAYLEELLRSINMPYIPDVIKYNSVSGGIINLPSLIVILFSANLVSKGMNTNKIINNSLVAIKFIVIITFIIFAMFHINSDNMVLVPEKKWNGVLTGVALVYFGFTGFTSLANTSQEAKNPSRDISIAIIVSIVITTIVYMLISFTLAASTHYSLLIDNKSSLSYAIRIKGYILLSVFISIGAAMSMLSVVFACLYASSRVIFVLAEDKLLPGFLTKINQNEVPSNAIWFSAIISIIVSQVLPIDRMYEIASLSAITDYIIACILVLYFRVYYAKQERPFKAPMIWVLSIITMIYLGYFFAYTCLTSDAGFSFAIYLLIMSVIYLIL